MRGRQWLALVLAGVLCFGTAAAAVAPQVASDQELKAVTAQVKTTLDLDTDGFDDFQGWCDEDVLLGKRWTLSWSGDGVWLNITADSRGKIYSYNFSQAAEEPVADTVLYRPGRLNLPHLPQDRSEAAFAVAQDFLAKVLEGGLETVDLENNYRPSLTQSVYRYSGTLLLNGLSSPTHLSLFVRADDLTVTRFWRSDESAGYLGDVPGAATAVTAAQAKSLLKSTVELEAKYVLQDDGKTARVQYVPVYGDDYYVDGQSGKLVDLTQLRQQLWRAAVTEDSLFNSAMDLGAAEESESAAGALKELSQAELEGAAILEDALSKENLDQAVRNAWPEMGLDKYTLSAASYSIAKKTLPDGTRATAGDYQVTCRLTYGRQSGSVLYNKYVTVDAKTGKVQALWSRRRYQGEEEDTISYITALTAAQAKADAILPTFAGANAPLVALAQTENGRDAKSWQHTFTYQHTANGYFFPDNAYTIGIDVTDGTLATLSGSFDEAVELVAPRRVVNPVTAVNAYADAMALPYAYLEVPVSISLAPDDVMPLLKKAGYSYVNALKTGYTLTQPEDGIVFGVDGETGEAVVRAATPQEDRSITYDDLQGHWVQTAAQALAVFGIGLGGGSLQPAASLTQLDMVALLCSVDGYSYDPATATGEDTDRLYNHAYALGLVTPETRDATAVITRGALVKLILDAAGYERVAAIPGIFRCDFADQAAIPQDELGYAALAQGLGLIRGGDQGEYAAGRAATRAEALAMLYQYMK